jgi:hypothetical protein
VFDCCRRPELLQQPEREGPKSQPGSMGEFARKRKTNLTVKFS